MPRNDLHFCCSPETGKRTSLFLIHHDQLYLSAHRCIGNEYSNVSQSGKFMRRNIGICGFFRRTANAGKSSQERLGRSGGVVNTSTVYMEFRVFSVSLIFYFACCVLELLLMICALFIALPRPLHHHFNREVVFVLYIAAIKYFEPLISAYNTILVSGFRLLAF